MAEEKRLIDANGSYTLNDCNETGYVLCFGGGFIDVYDQQGKHICQFWAGDAPAANVGDAIEKQKPKKPIYVDTRFRNHGKHISDGVSLSKCYKCPNCNSHIFHVFDSEKYCDRCGQALDWRTDDD